jgi:hypothetical protein
LGWELGLQPVPSASPDAPIEPEPQVVSMTRNLLTHVLKLKRPGRAHRRLVRCRVMRAIPAQPPSGACAMRSDRGRRARRR